MITPELAVYMWMFPCFIFFVFPFLCLPITLMVNKSEAPRPSQVHSNEIVSSEISYSQVNDKREYPRKEIDGVLGQVFAGNNNFSVTVNNISKRGICFGCSPDDLDQNTENLGIILTESGNNVHMPIKPQWIQKQGEKINVGASIINTQEIWSELTNNMQEARSGQVSQ